MRAPARQGLALEGVLDFRPGLFEVALGLVSEAFGAQAPAAGAGQAVFLKVPLTTWALCAIFLEMLMGGCLSGVIPRARARWRGRRGGGIGSLAGQRFWPPGGSARGQARPARPGVAPAGIAAGAGAAVAVAERAGGVVPLFVEDRVGAGGVALADQVVAVLADDGGLAAGLRPRGPRRAAAPRATAGAAASTLSPARASAPVTMPYGNRVPAEPVTWLFGFLHGHVLDELQELTVSPDETDDLLRLVPRDHCRDAPQTR